MRSTVTTFLLWSIGSTALALAKSCPIADTSIIAHTGTPVGKEEVVDGGAIRRNPYWSEVTNTKLHIVTLYVSQPGCKSPKTGVLYLTDVFGIQLAENKL